jgi:hypothetical protein
MLQHYLLLDEETTIDLYRSHIDPDDSLQQQWSELCRYRFQRYESLLDEIAEKLRGTNCAFLVMLVPSRIQAALISSGAQIPGIDPYLMFRMLRDSAAKRGFSFVDVSAEVKATPDAAGLFYPVDSHPAAGMNELLARGLVRHLTTRAGGLPGMLSEANR